jgi:hypothetical protein
MRYSCAFVPKWYDPAFWTEVLIFVLFSWLEHHKCEEIHERLPEKDPE